MADAWLGVVSIDVVLVVVAEGKFSLYSIDGVQSVLSSQYVVEIIIFSA